MTNEKVLNKKTPSKTIKTKKERYIFAVGRRKTAVARVRLSPGKGKIVVNNRPIDQYFPGRIAEKIYTKPFVVTDSLGKYNATVRVEGSGAKGQLWAVVHGLTRALDKENHDLYHSSLKKEKLLTRDPRVKERRKPGQMGKARKKKQSPKR